MPLPTWPAAVEREPAEEVDENAELENPLPEPREAPEKVLELKEPLPEP